MPQMFPENLLCVRCLLSTLRSASNFILTVAVEVDNSSPLHREASVGMQRRYISPHSKPWVPTSLRVEVI